MRIQLNACMACHSPNKYQIVPLQITQHHMGTNNADTWPASRITNDDKSNFCWLFIILESNTLKKTCRSSHRIHHKKIPVNVCWNGGLYCGIKLDYNYDRPISVDLSMPECVLNALNELQHSYPKRPQHAPHKWEHPNYGAKTQWAKE